MTRPSILPQLVAFRDALRDAAKQGEFFDDSPVVTGSVMLDPAGWVVDSGLHPDGISVDSTDDDTMLQNIAFWLEN